MVGWYKRIAEGSVHRRKAASFDRLSRLTLPLPPLKDQRRILKILGGIDDAIDKTEAVIEATERLRQALVQELLTRGIPGRHHEWKHAPGIGTIPACWEEVRLGSILCEPIRNGFSCTSPQWPTGEWMLTLGAVTERGFDPCKAKPAPSNSPRVRASMLRPGDLLVSRSNTRERVGFAGIYDGHPDHCSYPDLLMRVRLRPEEALAGYVEAVLLSQTGRRYFEREARGTSGSMVKVDHALLMRFPLATPPLEEQHAICRALRGIDALDKSEREPLTLLRTLKTEMADLLLAGRLWPAVEGGYARLPEA